MTRTKSEIIHMQQVLAAIYARAASHGIVMVLPSGTKFNLFSVKDQHLKYCQDKLPQNLG